LNLYHCRRVRGLGHEDGVVEQSDQSEFGEASDDKVPPDEAPSTGFSLKNLFTGQKKKKDEDERKDECEGKNGSADLI
jgi:hypothetical protein